MCDDLTVQTDCSRQTVRHKKEKISDQACAWTQREGKEWNTGKQFVVLLIEIELYNDVSAMNCLPVCTFESVLRK